MKNKTLINTTPSNDKSFEEFDLNLEWNNY